MALESITRLHKDAMIYLLQNRSREPIDLAVMAEDFSGARPNPMVMRDMIRGYRQDETAAHGAMQKRLEEVLELLEQRGWVVIQGSLMVRARRVRLTASGVKKAQGWLDERMKRDIR